MSEAPEGRLARSVSWQTLNVGFQVLFQLAFIKALAIFLTEAEWGIIGIALGVIGIIEIFAQLGVGPSLIQRKDLRDEQISSAFWVSLLLGLLFGLTTYVAAPAIAAANSTPVPRGRLSNSASPARRPFFLQGRPTAVPVTLKASCSPRLAGLGVGLRASRVWPPISSAPCSSRTERIPASV